MTAVDGSWCASYDWRSVDQQQLARSWPSIQGKCEKLLALVMQKAQE